MPDIRLPTRPATLPAAQALPEAYFLMVGAGVALPTPLFISDLDNDDHSIGGVSKTLAQMWEEDPAWAEYDSSMVVPGQGFVYDAASGFKGPVATAALFAALNVTSGITLVFDYSFEADGTAEGYVNFAEITDAAYTEGWLYGHGTSAYGEGAKDYDVVNNLQAVADGTHRVACTLSPTVIASSIDGLATRVAAGDPQNNALADRLGFYGSRSGGVGNMVIKLKKITGYAPQDAADLPAMSA